MKTSKLLAFLAVISVVLIAGCNKNESWINSPDSGNSLMPLKSKTITTVVPLGSAATFAVLGATEVTNVGPSVITGDLGVSPATSITGFPPGIVNGTIYSNGPVAAAAQIDARAAYIYLMAQTPDETSTIVTYLDGLTFTPGVYKFQSANLAVNGTLTLDFQGDPNALFIFQTESTLVTMSNSNVVAINTGKIGPKDCLGSNVFWAVGSSATISGAEFIGTVIAKTAITMTNPENTIANVAGRLLALEAQVTMINSIISTCGTSVGGKPGHNPKPCRDFVTGGGWINDKETFGVSGGIKNGKFWGQLSYNNHDGIKVKSTEVTGYKVIDATTREIKGLAKIDGHGSFEYTVTVSDNGEPGRHDTFSLVLSNGFSTTGTGTLTGGNIQLHKVCGDKKDDEHHNDGYEAEGNNNCESHNGRR